MKYIIQIYEGEINGHGEKERLPEEFQYEFEQEMLKQVHELKTNSEKRDGLREIYHQKFTNPHSSGVKNQMHSRVLSLSRESTSSKKPPTYQFWWTDLDVIP